jgi:hypothetical protein
VSAKDAKDKASAYRRGGEGDDKGKKPLAPAPAPLRNKLEARKEKKKRKKKEKNTPEPADFLCTKHEQCQ